MTEQQAMRMALEAFEKIIHWYALRDRNDVLLNFVDQNPEIKKAMQAITALRQALEKQPAVVSIDTSQKRVEKAGENVHEQQTADEPVAFFDLQGESFYWAKPTKVIPPVTVKVEPLPLYTTPPQRTWTGLTDEEWLSLGCKSVEEVRIGVAIEAALRRKNG